METLHAPHFIILVAATINPPPAIAPTRRHKAAHPALREVMIAGAMKAMSVPKSHAANGRMMETYAAEAAGT